MAKNLTLPFVKAGWALFHTDGSYELEQDEDWGKAPEIHPTRRRAANACAEFDQDCRPKPVRVRITIEEFQK